MPANLENSAVATAQRSVFIPFPKKGNAKECSNYVCVMSTIILITHTSKVMLKILQVRLYQALPWTKNFQMLKLDLEKAEEPEIKLPISIGSLKKAREFQKNIYFFFIDYARAFDCVDHRKLENSRDTRPSYLPPEKSVCGSRSNS